jgi:hypothetical protein
MIEFSRWIRKTHPNYFTESEDLTANPQSPNPQDPHAIKSSIYTTMPTPKDFKSKASPAIDKILNGLSIAANNEIAKCNRTVVAANNANDRTSALKQLNDFTAFAQETYKRTEDILNKQGVNMFYCLEIDKIIDKTKITERLVANEIYKLQNDLRRSQENGKRSPVYALMEMMDYNQNIITTQFERLFDEFLDEYFKSGKIDETENKIKDFFCYVPPVNSPEVGNGLVAVNQAAQRYQMILEPFVQQGQIKIPKK